jgi:glycosyltransferase involved in cell wall biosynthesis
MATAAPSLTILLPCHDEERAIASVIEEYRRVFSDARILVVDNASSDRTAEIARSLGVEVIEEPRKGKARGVLTALSHVDTDLLLMADGDASYPAEGGRLLVEHYVRTGADMINGLRAPGQGPDAAVFRPAHQAGTRAFEAAVRLLFGVHTRDVFSGLRLFSRRFYEHVPLLHDGFELEMELTVQAVDKGFRSEEVPVPFRARWEGTHSKLSTVRDGFRILRALLLFHRDYRPLQYFSVLGSGAFTAGITAGWFPVAEFFRTGQILRLPLAVLAASLVIVAVVTFFSGVMLESGLRANRELFQVNLRAADAERNRAARRLRQADTAPRIARS